MKTLERKVGVLYRFRCDECKSLFEMTEEESDKSDWEFTSEEDKKLGVPYNPYNYFKCPICGCVREMDMSTFHRYLVMNNGTEVMDY